MTKIIPVISKFYNEYRSKTSKKLKVIDAYLLYILLTGIVQFVYCLLVGTFPFNAFLSGFISCVSCFVLAGKCKTSILKAVRSFLYLQCLKT
nr:dolichyl-diphosphooligosaccharide--protein glycosyltransferase subunit DAD1 [Leptinotarsa decemlineata]